jgi:diguanylate cyclase (GGDEF)-like protein
VAVPHISVDDVVDRLDRGVGAPTLDRLLLVVAAAIVAAIELGLDGPSVVVLGWAIVAGIAAVAGWRTEALGVVTAAAIVGVVAMPRGAPGGLLLAEAAGRMVGLGAVVMVVVWAVGAGRELARRCRIDPRTGLLNASGFASALERERQRSLRSGTPLALAYLDLDGLKAANDRWGHAAGDVLLSRFADRLDGCRRTVDVAGRLGGDEFALLLPGTDADGATQALERLLRSTEAPPTCLPVSAGAVCWEVPPSTADMLRTADAAMYQVKRAGGGGFWVREVRATPGVRGPRERRRPSLAG